MKDRYKYHKIRSQKHLPIHLSVEYLSIELLFIIFRPECRKMIYEIQINHPASYKNPRPTPQHELTTSIQTHLHTKHQPQKNINRNRGSLWFRINQCRRGKEAISRIAFGIPIHCWPYQLAASQPPQRRINPPSKLPWQLWWKELGGF